MVRFCRTGPPCLFGKTWLCAVYRPISDLILFRLRCGILAGAVGCILDAIKYLPDALIACGLEEAHFGLLPGSEQRIDGGQEVFLISLGICIGLIDLVNALLDVFLTATLVYESSDLVHSASAARTDIESLLDELAKHWKDFCEYFVADFSLLLELADVKT